MEKRKNIAFLLSRIKNSGGISRVSSIISKELSNKSQFNIHAISYQKKQLNAYNWGTQLIYHSLHDKDDITLKRGLFKGTIRLRRLIRENNIDVLICCGHELATLAVLATLGKKCQLVYWSHSSFKSKTNERFKNANEKILCLFAPYIITLTKTDMINYKKESNAKQVEQIYNPIDPLFTNINRSYKEASNKIISVGRLSFPKNYLLLVDVAIEVLGKNNNLVWHIYGNGSEGSKIEEKIFKNNLQNKLVLKGQVNNLYEIYNDYSLMVMTSRYEGFPMSLVEAMACKLPMISFDVPTGPNEIIMNGINGYLIEPLNVKEMADKINSLINDRNKKLAFSEANDQLMKQFEIEQIIDKWIIFLGYIVQK